MFCAREQVEQQTAFFAWRAQEKKVLVDAQQSAKRKFDEDLRKQRVHNQHTKG